MRDFDSIYADYYDLVFRYIRSLCRDGSHAGNIHRCVCDTMGKRIA